MSDRQSSRSTPGQLQRIPLPQEWWTEQFEVQSNGLAQIHSVWLSCTASTRDSAFCTMSVWDTKYQLSVTCYRKRAWELAALGYMNISLSKVQGNKEHKEKTRFKPTVEDDSSSEGVCTVGDGGWWRNDHHSAVSSPCMQWLHNDTEDGP